MSWLDSELRRRIPVTVNNNGGAATIDVSFAVPSVWPDFWDNYIEGDNILRMDTCKSQIGRIDFLHFRY